MTRERKRPDAEGTPEKKAPGCCGVGYYSEPLCYVEEGKGKTRFATVPLCAGCRKIKGDYRMDRADGNPNVAALQRSFQGVSWSMMLETHSWPPFNFERRAGVPCLIPEGYKGELHVQAEMTEEDPR